MRLKKTCALRDGAVLTLRSLEPEDARETLRVCRQASGETLNLMRYPDEWTITDEREAEMLRNAQSAAKSLMLGAFLEGKMIGMGSFLPLSNADRVRHRAGLGISILKAHWGRGIGSAMMQTLIDEAKKTALEQLELEAVSTNGRAISLYGRFGFVEFARHPRMMKYRDGTYADMVLMMLDLQAEA